MTIPMVMPVETERSIRKLILDICQEQSRNVVDISRELALMVDSVAEEKNKDAKTHYQNMQPILENFEKTKLRLLEEVAAVGTLLTSREDILHLIFRIGEIADYANGVAFRLSAISERGWKVDKKLLKRLSELSTVVLEEMSKIRDTMMSLGFKPGKAIDLSRSVEEAEKKVDTIYRAFDMEILDGLKSSGGKTPLRTYLLMRDLIWHLEEMADLGVDVVDIIRVIALTG